MATTEQPKVNKTAFVRNVLKDIGAIAAVPPEGWRQKVEEALAKQNLDMHQVTIYQIRQKSMQAAGIIPIKQPKVPAVPAVDAVPDAPKAKAKATKATKAKTEAKATFTQSDILDMSLKTLAGLQSVEKFAENFGGLDGLSQAIETIRFLKN